VFEGLVLVARSRYLLGICLFIWLYTSLSTFLYFEQAHIVAAAFDDSAQRTRVFALIDLAVNGLTIGIQLLATGRLIQRWGLSAALALVPVLLALGFAGLAVAPVLPLLLTVQIARRAGNYALTRPARESLFTLVDRSSRYKAKNFIDTLVYRGGDALSAWAFAGLQALGLGLAGIAALAVPLALGWAWLGWGLGRKAGPAAEWTPDHRG
jgi:AAA family ATP:ADP antiporter